MSLLFRVNVTHPGALFFSQCKPHVKCRYLSLLTQTQNLKPRTYTHNWRNFLYNKVLFSSSRLKSGKDDLSSVVVPVPIKLTAGNPDDINVGEELAKKISKADVGKIISKFLKSPEVSILAAEHGLNSKLYHQAAVSFRQFCMQCESLPVDLHVLLSDIIQDAAPTEEIFPYFLTHAREVFPHLECIDDLKKISDLRLPGNWYHQARSINRKLIFHSGPTNSGKTYQALESFMSAKSGVYCGPLKLLVAEVFQKANEKGTPCDLVTGEERQTVLPDNAEANHTACTIEMVSVENKYHVAVIDEIQMIRDYGRGWAWTRALLGIAADEIHICGEAAAVDIVKEIAESLGETVEVREYQRMTPLTIEKKALLSLNNVQPGDCIVCFNKHDIFKITLELERNGHECAVIYGGLPPGTKLAQAKKFNDPNHSCKILVATDAIGMGLNLSIRRIIFYSVMKPVVNEKGEKDKDVIPVSQALQIAGRAGRFNTQYSDGFVTTFSSNDLTTLKSTLAKPVEPIIRAGLHPTADQVELFGYHLPDATLSNLIDIFVSLCMMDSSSYFMCDTTSFKALADMVQHVELPLRARYVFCCAPINTKLAFVCTMFVKFSKVYSLNDPLTEAKLCQIIGWPFAVPQTVMDLAHQEAVFDVLDLYLWLSYRFPDLFPDMSGVRCIQHELDDLIQKGVFNIIQLLRVADENHTTTFGDSEADSEDPFKYNGKNFGYKVENDSYGHYKGGGFKRNNYSDGEQGQFGKGRLTKKLLAEGNITPDQLQELQKEWVRSLNQIESPSFRGNAKGHKPTRRTRK